MKNTIFKVYEAFSSRTLKAQKKELAETIYSLVDKLNENTNRELFNDESRIQAIERFTGLITPTIEEKFRLVRELKTPSSIKNDLLKVISIIDDIQIINETINSLIIPLVQLDSFNAMYNKGNTIFEEHCSEISKQYKKIDPDQVNLNEGNKNPTIYTNEKKPCYSCVKYWQKLLNSIETYQFTGRDATLIKSKYIDGIHDLARDLQGESHDTKFTTGLDIEYLQSLLNKSS